VARPVLEAEAAAQEAEVASQQEAEAEVTAAEEA